MQKVGKGRFYHILKVEPEKKLKPKKTINKLKVLSFLPLLAVTSNTK